MTKKSIKAQLILNFTITITMIFLLIFGATFFNVQNDVNELKEHSIQKMVSQANENISQMIDGMFSTAYTIASDPVVSNSTLGLEDKTDILLKYQADRGISSIGYVSGDGYLISTDGFENDISSRDYFKDLMAGGKYISNPSFNTATQSQIIFIGVPLYDQGSIFACMTLTFGSDYLSQYISTIDYMGKGNAYMLSSTGTVIASTNMDDVLNKYNVIEASEEDSSLKEAAKVTEKMINSNKGHVELGGNILFYEKLEDLNGWTMVFSIPKSAFNSEISTLIKVFVLSGIFGITLVLAISFAVGSHIGNRLMKLKGKLESISDGDFTVQLDDKELEKSDEIGIIYQSTQHTIESIKQILISMKDITEKLSTESNTLDKTSQSLLMGTDSVANSMSEIQKGNSEQATEIENIYYEVEKFNTNFENIATNIGEVVVTSSDASDKLKCGNKDIIDLQDSFSTFNQQFDEFRTIIHDMTDSLSSINMITSTIADIADQTNLLSLNASIEAARAGEVGKGFGVVAIEISKLADQCSASIDSINEAVGNIISIGENLINSTEEMGNQINHQSNIIEETLVSFKELTSNMDAMLPQIREISEISQENLKASKIIGDSIQNVTAISEELLATTTDVTNVTSSFQDSSQNVSSSSEQILDFSDVLNKLSFQFKVHE